MHIYVKLDVACLPRSNLTAASNYFKEHLRSIDLLSVGKIAESFTKFLMYVLFVISCTTILHLTSSYTNINKYILGYNF